MAEFDSQLLDSERDVIRATQEISVDIGGAVMMLFFNKVVRCNTSVVVNVQKMNLSKYISNARTKRLPLTTKRVGKGYYKGNGARKEGKINSKARFIQDKEMLTELVVPDLTNFKLKAYVGPGAKRHIIERDPDLDL